MGNSSSTTVLPLESNFLVPNGTFLVSLLAFAILIFIFGKYIIPPINKAMTSRQEAIRKEFAELEEAQTDARKAEADYKEQLNDAKHEAARIREEAREQGAQIVQEAREKAQSEADRVIEHAHAQIERTAGQAFNIGGGPANTTSLLELLDLIASLTGTCPAFEIEPWRPADQRYYVSNPGKFERATGWRPRTSVHDGVQRLMDWLLESGVAAPAAVTAGRAS